MRLLLTLPWMLALLCVALHSAPLDTLITASDLLKINHLSSPAISPDSQKIVYVVRTSEPDSSGKLHDLSRLWLASTDGDSSPRSLTLAGSDVHSPAWHPSGDRIVFVRAENDGRSRIWVLPVAGGEPYPVSPPLRGAGAPQWSPDGTQLLFTAIVTYSEVQAALEKSSASITTPPWSLEKPSAPPSPDPVPPAVSSKTDPKKTSEVKPAPPVDPSPDGSITERRAWLEKNVIAGSPVITHRPKLNANADAGDELEFTHLFIISRADAEPVDLTPGFVSRDRAAWFPDSQTIVCRGPASDRDHPDRVNATTLFVLKADGSDLRPLLKPDDYSLDNPAVSPDGKHVACTAHPVAKPIELGHGQTRIAVVGIADGKLKLITEKFDRAADQPRWSADGKFIYFTAETNGGVPLHRVSSGGGNPERISSPDTWVTGYATSADDVALVIGRAANPGELYRTRPNGRSLRILTAHNSDWLRDKKTANPERRKLKQPDGTQIEYWFVKPPYAENGFHYPLLVMIHDGPAIMWGAGNPAQWHELQFFATRGYGIVFVNPRGSSGYGSRFQQATFQQWAPGPAGDVLAAAGAISRDRWIDEDRQVILGEGYGAYLAAWIVSIDSRFKAAVAARGVYDLTSFLGGVDSWPLLAPHFGGYLWQPEIRKLLGAQSPLSRAASIRTSLLLQQNESDDPSVNAQGALLYRSLKALERPVELARYPRNVARSPRDTDDLAQRIDRLTRIDEFFQRFIGTPAQLVPPPPLPPVPSAPTPPPPPAAPTPPAAPPAMEPAMGETMMGGGSETMSGK